MLTVLHVLEALVGGTARHVTDLVTHTTGVRHVVVVPPKRRGDVTDSTAPPAMAAAGADVRVIDMRRLPPHPANLTAFLAIRQVVREVQPDIIHGHASVGGALARLVALRQPVGVVWTPNGVMTAPPVVAAERALARVTDTIVAVSESEAQLLREQRYTPRRGITVIPNGIVLEPPDPIDLRAMAGVPADAPLVGTISRLAPQKAPLDFVEMCRLVAAAVPEAHFVLVGDGRLAAEVDAAVQAWDTAGRFHRIPELPHAAGALPSLDVFVLTSVYEGAPYAPLEAMRAGVPVVLTDVVGSRDVISHNETGLLVEPGNPARMAQIVQELLASRGKSLSLAKRAGESLVKRYSARAMASAHQSLYEGLLRDRDRVGDSPHRRPAADDL